MKMEVTHENLRADGYSVTAAAAAANAAFAVAIHPCHNTFQLNEQ